MRNIIAVALFCSLTFLSGCALTDLMAGIERNDEGKVVKVSGGVAEVGFSIIDALIGGGSATLLGGAALRFYRHKRIVASGGKDDNADGVPDEQQPKA